MHSAGSITWVSASKIRYPPRAMGLSSSLVLVGLLEEVRHPLHDLVFRIDRVQDARACQGVARKETLVEHLTAAERAPRDVPGQAKELDAVPGGGGIRGQVLLDVRSQRTPEVGLAGDDHETTGPEQLEDLHHPGIRG